MYYPWPSKFPPVASTRSVGELMRHPDFDAAKHGGDRAAAERLVADLLDPDSVAALVRAHRNARLVVVGGATSDANQIPAAYADAITKLSALPLDRSVLRINSPKHTGKSAVGRFIARAQFAGALRAGANYIALDDVMTQGGTISELRQFITRNGSRLVAVATLAYTKSSVMSNGLQIAPTAETRARLIAQFNPKQLGALLKSYGVYDGDILSLTESESLMLCRFKTIEQLDSALRSEAETMVSPVPLPAEPTNQKRKACAL